MDVPLVPLPGRNTEKPVPEPVLVFIGIINQIQTKQLIEAADTSASIQHLLLAGEEGVTLRANFNLNVLLGRPGFDHITAGALNGSLFVIGMDAFLHFMFTSFSQGISRHKRN